MIPWEERDNIPIHRITSSLKIVSIEPNDRPKLKGETDGTSKVMSVGDKFELTLRNFVSSLMKRDFDFLDDAKLKEILSSLKQSNQLGTVLSKWKKVYSKSENKLSTD